ncbi:MAG TPA: aldose 1-epimerase [Acidimicrobiia bacterium]
MTVAIAKGELQAVFEPAVGMLGTSLRLRGNEFVALPGGVATYRNGHQTGIPFLAPWANRLDGWRYRVGAVDVDLAGLPLHTDGHGLPIHGTMTAVEGWEVAAREPDRIRARFDYGARPDLLAAFPFPHVVEIDARVTRESLEMTTTLRPTTDRAVPLAFGFHPYLRLPAGDRSTWRLLMPARRHLALDGRGIPTGESAAEPAEAAAIGKRTFDDLYTLDDDHQLGLETDDHRVVVRYDEGYPYAQVFAPPGTEFVCLEAMTAPTNALVTGDARVVEPGDVFHARFAIVVG